MRRSMCAGALITVSALLVLASAASAGSPWTPLTDPLGAGMPNGPVIRPAGHNCSFNLLISVVANHEQQRQIRLGPPALAGTVETDLRGELNLSFTNQSTGAAVTRDVSGPTKTVAYPDGTGVITGAGNNWWTFGPVSRGNTGEPGAFTSTGPFVLDFSGNFVTSFKAKHVTDLCALLGA